MANIDIIKLSQQNKPKYDELIKYIAEYWEYLTYEELLVEIQRDFKLELTKGNLETIRISANLPKQVDFGYDFHWSHDAVDCIAIVCKLRNQKYQLSGC